MHQNPRQFEDFKWEMDKFSKTYKFSDINYAVASREDKEAMFLEYSELLNSLDSGATTKITINNRRLNRANFEKTILLPLKGDALDEYREEYNRMLLDKATGANAIIQEKYITISICKKNVEEARNYFARVGADLIAHFGRLGSKCVELEPDERLRIFHDFYRAGEETEFRFDIKETRRKGHDFKDFICPDSMEFTGDYFKIGERYGRVLFLREYASYIKDSMVAEMTDLNRNLMMSIDVIPVPTDEAVREAESRLLGVETNATNWQRRQNANNNFSAQLPYDIEQQRKEMKEFLDDLTTRDQRMMFAVLTMVHTADTKEQLDNDTEALLTTARKHLCQFGILKFQQLDGLNTAMPFGVRKIESFRTLTTESLAVFIPFRVQDICHTNGVYYGQNVISKNMIIADRRQLLNGNEFILGVSGGGKSFTAKNEIINQMLSGDSDILLIDPEREYTPLVRALGGEIINISATSPTHINAMDMNREYGDGANPVILKSEFIMSLCEQLIGGNNLGAVQKSIIDRCTAKDIVAAAKNEEPDDYLYISKEKYEEYSALSGKVGVSDLLVTGVGTIGVPYLVRNLEPLYFKDGNIIWFQNSDKIDGKFLFYSFSAEQIQGFINESAGIGTVGTYTIESGKKTPISLPNQIEQAKVGEFFQQLDNLITLHQRELEKLQNIKKSMLEKMFV